MDALIQTYEGDDVVISRHALEELGVKPGDNIVIRPQIQLEPTHLPPGKIDELKKILDDAAGSWTEEDEAAFRLNRQQWAEWQPRNSS